MNHGWPPTLALLAALGMTDIREMNALKIVLVAAINGAAAVTSIATGSIAWTRAVVMIAGAWCYSAAHYAQKSPQQLIRAMVPLLG